MTYIPDLVGQQTMAESSPVVIASDQTPLPIQQDASVLSAFGDLTTVTYTPVFQGDFIYGLNTQLWQTAVTSGTGATVDTNGGRLRLQSGTNSAGYAYILPRKLTKYKPGQGVMVRFTPAWANNAASNTTLYGPGTIVSNAPYDGYFLGYNGTTFGIAHYTAGSLVGSFISQASFNGDTCDGNGASGFNWNKANGVPVMIQCPFLGYGNIKFYVQNPTTSRWILFHTIRYANSSAAIQISNPSMYFCSFTKNSGNTTNITSHVGSILSAIYGERNFDSNPRWAADITKTVSATEGNIISIRNCTSYNGTPNRGLIRINQISVGISTNQNLTIRIKKGVTLGGSPSWTTISGSTADSGATITSGNSIASIDTAGTTITGGTYIFNFNVGSSGTVPIDVTSYDLFIEPGEVLTISGVATGNTSTGLSVNWAEEI